MSSTSNVEVEAPNGEYGAAIDYRHISERQHIPSVGGTDLLRKLQSPTTLSSSSNNNNNKLQLTNGSSTSDSSLSNANSTATTRLPQTPSISLPKLSDLSQTTTTNDSQASHHQARPPLGGHDATNGHPEDQHHESSLALNDANDGDPLIALEAAQSNLQLSRLNSIVPPYATRDETLEARELLAPPANLSTTTITTTTNILNTTTTINRQEPPQLQQPVPPSALGNQSNFLHYQHHHIVPTTLNTTHTANVRLLRLNRTHSMPIFIKHTLPSGLSPFEHPRAINTNTNTNTNHHHQLLAESTATATAAAPDGANLSASLSRHFQNYQTTNLTAAIGNQQQQQQHNRETIISNQNNNNNFALLPSWPSVYVAQRIKDIVPGQQHPESTSLPPPPRNASEFPIWTRILNETVAKKDRWLESEVEYETEQLNYRRRTKDNDKLRHAQPTQSSDEEAKKSTHIKSSNETTFGLGKANNQSQSQSQNSLDLIKLLRQAATPPNSNKSGNGPMESLMVTNKTIVSLVCDTNKMVVRFKFRRPFYGWLATNLDPNDNCQLVGNGSQYYVMSIGLDACGTRQEAPRLFINNVEIQFLSNIRQNKNKLELQQQQDDEVELKTLICSYPPSPPRANLTNTDQMTQRPGLGGASKEREGEEEEEDEQKQQETIWLINNNNNNRQSDKIIESTPPADKNNQLAPMAKLIYFEPLILIIGFLLLALALATLATSALLMRRRARQLIPTPRSNSSSVSSSSALETNNMAPNSPPTTTTPRFYHTSPAQLANSRNLRLVAPPLISIGKKAATPTRKRTAGAGASGGRMIGKSNRSYKLIGRRLANVEPSRESASSYKRRLKHERANQLSGQTTCSSSSASFSSSSPLSPGADRRRRLETAADSLEERGGAKAGEQDKSSVTTIEIPFVGQRSSNKVVEAIEHDARISLVPTGGGGDASQQFKPAKNQDYFSLAPDGFNQRKFATINSNEQPTKGRKGFGSASPTTTVINSKQTNTMDSPRHASSSHKKASPLSAHIFGSFRSKLTSPSEYIRLERISQILLTNVDSPTARQEDKWHLNETMASDERVQLANLMQNDELFRSNVVESVDLETFNRKLRNNPKYSERFTHKTWNLFRQIVLDEDVPENRTIHSSPSPPTKVDRHQSDELTTPDDHRIARKLTPVQMKDISNQLANDEKKKRRTSKMMIIGTSDANVQTSNCSDEDQYNTDSLEQTTHKQLNQTRGEKGFLIDGTIHSANQPIIRVSKYNSTFTTHDGRRSIAVDAMTNFSTDLSNNNNNNNFSAYTRSRIEQTTRYQEDQFIGDDSLPDDSDRKANRIEYRNKIISSHHSSMSSSLSSSSSLSPPRDNYNLRRHAK